MHKWYAAIVLSAIHMPSVAASDPQFFGFLRARDLTPLVICVWTCVRHIQVRCGPSRPTSHIRALSPEVERYLTSAAVPSASQHSRRDSIIPFRSPSHAHAEQDGRACPLVG